MGTYSFNLRTLTNSERPSTNQLSGAPLHPRGPILAGSGTRHQRQKCDEGVHPVFGSRVLGRD